MITLVRTNSDSKDFVSLVNQLDAELADRDGADHSFYSQFNTIDKIKYVVLALEIKTPTGCGAIKQYDSSTMEVKRMFVAKVSRGKGIAMKILSELEHWAADLSFKKCVLETGKRQPEAIRLYKKCGYRQIANYGQYVGVENSICFEKDLT